MELRIKSAQWGNTGRGHRSILHIRRLSLATVESLLTSLHAHFNRVAAICVSKYDTHAILTGITLAGHLSQLVLYIEACMIAIPSGICYT